MPETSLRTRDNLICEGFPYMPGVKYFIFFDEESDSQVEIASSGNQGQTYGNIYMFNV